MADKANFLESEQLSIVRGFSIFDIKKSLQGIRLLFLKP